MSYVYKVHHAKFWASSFPYTIIVLFGLEWYGMVCLGLNLCSILMQNSGLLAQKMNELWSLLEY